MDGKRSDFLRREHSRRGHKLTVESFSSKVPALGHTEGTFEKCSCGWSGWLSVNSFVMKGNYG
jgi:hypothetical protein